MEGVLDKKFEIKLKITRRWKTIRPQEFQDHTNPRERTVVGGFNSWPLIFKGQGSHCIMFEKLAHFGCPQTIIGLLLIRPGEYREKKSLSVYTGKSW